MNMDRARIVERFVVSASEALQQSDERERIETIGNLEAGNATKKAQLYQPWLPPAVFRFLFGVNWDIFYGAALILSTCLVNWAESLPINVAVAVVILTYIDVVVAIDCIVSLSVRVYECVCCLFGMMFDDYSFSNFRLVFANVFGVIMDGYCCLPWLIFYTLDWSSQYFVWLNLLRLSRLITPRRMALDKNMYEWLYSDLKEKHVKLSEKDFDKEWENAKRLANNNPNLRKRQRGKRKQL